MTANGCDAKNWFKIFHKYNIGFLLLRFLRAYRVDCGQSRHFPSSNSAAHWRMIETLDLKKKNKSSNTPKQHNLSTSCRHANQIRHLQNISAEIVHLNRRNENQLLVQQRELLQQVLFFCHHFKTANNKFLCNRHHNICMIDRSIPVDSFCIKTVTFHKLT